MFLGSNTDATTTDLDEQVASPVESDPHPVAPLNGIDSNEMWSSKENSVTFPAQVNAADETDFSASLDEPEAAEDAQKTLKSQSSTDPDFHWNLHAPEFEFRPREVQSQQPTETVSASASTVEPIVPEERKLSATELLVRSSNDVELAVLLAAANEDPDEADDADQMISPRSDAIDDHHQHGLANGNLHLERIILIISLGFFFLLLLVGTVGFRYRLSVVYRYE